MEVRVSEKTANEILDSNNPMKSAIDEIGKGIEYKGVTITAKVKKGFASIGLSILGFFI